MELYLVACILLRFALCILKWWRGNFASVISLMPYEWIIILTSIILGTHCIPQHCSGTDRIELKNLFSLSWSWQSNDQTKQYVHMLNSTLTATERTLLHPRELPKVLRPYLGGKTFMPFWGALTKEAKGRN